MDQQPADDPDDVRRIGHDPDAFEAFYRAHLDAVQRFVARRVADPHLAADLTADVFVAAVDAAAGYRPERGNPAAWLTGVALLDPDSLARIEERIDAERETRRLYDALRALRPRDRALMELVAVEGMPVADAAAVLGVKPATARVRLHRSRRLVQSHLQSPHPAAEAALSPEVPS